MNIPDLQTMRRRLVMITRQNHWSREQIRQLRDALEASERARIQAKASELHGPALAYNEVQSWGRLCEDMGIIRASQWLRKRTVHMHVIPKQVIRRAQTRRLERRRLIRWWKVNT